MLNKILSLVLGEGSQRRKEAMEETKMAKDIRLSSSTRDIDKTIGYLIKHEINVNYKVF